MSLTPKVYFDEDWENGLEEKIIEDGPWCSYSLFKLGLEAEKHNLIPDFNGLLAPKHLSGFTPLSHQLEAATEVIERMNGKAILADEVGLGKTIEAGLILKEYMIRGLASKILILVPASLVSQWAKELNQKFHIPAVIYRKGYGWNSECIITSIDTAKREPHRSAILEQTYDIVIIDEAHKLKNNKTKNYEFVQKIQRKFCLLLTATPIQNKLEEIFYLVSLLKPGHLGSYAKFNERFSTKKRSLKDDAYLKELVNMVMIRNKRQDTGIEWTKRKVETIFIDFTEKEQALYDGVSSFRKELPDGIGSTFSSLILQREACSSREAVYFTLKNMLDRNPDAGQSFKEAIHSLIKQVELVDCNSKAKKALELIHSIKDKVIIFTEYRATQLYLQWFLKQNGITSVPFRGGFKRSKKDWMKELFEKQAQVLIATEAGGEGINLQFCHHIINFDLPWNPMRLEQRIGRIHRLGQTEDVRIYNFATRNTIEDHIMKILYEKIQLFERVVGELDDILTRLEVKNLEEHLTDILNKSKTEGEMKVKMDNLTSLIQLAQDLKKEVPSHAATGNS